jgi:hypothetical protein
LQTLLELRCEDLLLGKCLCLRETCHGRKLGFGGWHGKQ